MSGLVKTKIIVTIGPKCQAAETIRQLIEAGTDIFRLNFSYGTYQEHKKNIENIRLMSKETAKNVSILQDLQGPKIRLKEIEGGRAWLKEGDEFILTEREVKGNSHQASISYGEIIRDVKPGEVLYINDGLIKLEVREVTAQEIITRVIEGGEIGSHNGINFPQSQLSIPAMTDKDKQDLSFGLENGVDLVALSFVKTRDDLRLIKSLMEQVGTTIPVIAKIEKWEAVNHLEEIIAEAEGMMVARGDLGVELPLEKIPIIQKKIISLARSCGKPVITATQMLNSMIENPVPTRAEVNDVANAVFDGTDALMLSNETAAGKYPVEAVKMMRKIVLETENSDLFVHQIETSPEPDELVVPEAIAISVKKIAERVGARVIITATESGKTACLISKYQPAQPVLALTPSLKTLRFLNLKWGVYPCQVERFKSVDEILKEGPALAQQLGFIQPGQNYLITCGTHTGITGSTNLLKVDRC